MQKLNKDYYSVVFPPHTNRGVQNTSNSDFNFSVVGYSRLPITVVALALARSGRARNLALGYPIGGPSEVEPMGVRPYPCYSYISRSDNSPVSNNDDYHVILRSINYPDGESDMWAVRVPNKIQLPLDRLQKTPDKGVNCDYSALRYLTNEVQSLDLPDGKSIPTERQVKNLELLNEAIKQEDKFEQLQQSSVARSRKMVYRYVRYYGLGGLVTWTFGKKDNVIDSEVALDLVSRFLKVHGQEWFGSAPFISVAEPYKDGTGFHVHSATWSQSKLQKQHYGGSHIPYKAIITAWTNFLRGQGYEAGENANYCRWNYGIENGKHANISPQRCGAYIAKYITKTDFADYKPNMHRYRPYNCPGVPFAIDSQVATLAEAEQLLLLNTDKQPHYFVSDFGVVYGFRVSYERDEQLRDTG